MYYLLACLILPFLVSTEVILTESRRRIASYSSDTTSHDSDAEATGFDGFGDFGGFRGFNQFHGVMSSALTDLDGQFDHAGFEGAQSKKFEAGHVSSFGVPEEFDTKSFGQGLGIKSPASYVLPYSAHEQHGSPKKSPYKSSVYTKNKSHSPPRYSVKPTAYTYAAPKSVANLYGISDSKKYSQIHDVQPSYGPSAYTAPPAHLLQSYSHISDSSPLGVTSSRYQQNHLYQRQIHKPYEYGSIEGLEY